MVGDSLYWVSKRQLTTSYSTKEAEFYVTNEYTKKLTRLQNVFHDFNISSVLTKLPIKMYNDNEATENDLVIKRQRD